MSAHVVPVIGQQLTMGCCAAAFAMMESWRANASVPISETLRRLGQDYENAYSSNHGIGAAQAVAAAQHVQGLTREPPLNPTTARWLQLVASSPLFVIVDEDAHPGLFAVHARIVIEIESKGPNMVHYIDPAGNSLNGSVQEQTLAQFVSYYEQLAGAIWAGVQRVHY